jgi:hypothetical protein
MGCEGITAKGPSRVDLCPDCGRSFVVPVALLDIVDEGLYLVVLHCKNCDRMAVGIHEDAEMEQVDIAMDHAAAEIAAFAEILDLACFIEEGDAFARALHAGALLPEDF